jgi:cyclophilin family peptidyl-prolyl cis-trans isomerase
MNGKAPDVCRVKFEATKGDIVLELRREWAPIGVDRFYNLVRRGYYDGVKFHRIRAEYWAQFGINGEPKILQGGSSLEREVRHLAGQLLRGAA